MQDDTQADGRQRMEAVEPHPEERDGSGFPRFSQVEREPEPDDSKASEIKYRAVDFFGNPWYSLMLWLGLAIPAGIQGYQQEKQFPVAGLLGAITPATVIVIVAFIYARRHK